ncbi:MAG: CapA family protein [Oscillospiraceae bacterium]|nr:CapA family protein [Oscillospiraceae bacterium]
MSKKILKFKNIAAAAILGAVLAAFLSACGIISGAGSGGGDEPTFSSKDNYERNDVFVDGMSSPPKRTEPNSQSETKPATEPPVDIESEGETKPEPATEEQPFHGPTLPIATEPPAVPQEKDGTVRLSFLAAGDNIMHLNMINDAAERASEGESFNFKDMYRDVENLVKGYDIALVNVETPIAGDEFKYDGYPNFNTPKENAFALMDIGFGIINTANNHMLDKWEKGYQNSINFWDSQAGILQIGSFKNKEDFENIRIYEKNGVTIAFLSYTYSTNGMTLPAGSEMVIPYIDAATIERQVKAARPLADLLFVVMHWGDEDSFSPNQQQRNLAQMMVDNDVDVIIGMHPHVFQETKWVARANGKKTLLTYSIGNMISGMLGAKNMIGGFLSFDIVKTTKNGASETTIENAEIIPIMTHYNMQRKRFQIYRFEDYTEELAKAHGNINSDNKFSYKYIKDLIIANVAPEFLSDFYK